MHCEAGPPHWKFICINFQCGGPALRCIYLIPKIPTNYHTDRHNITKGEQATGQTDGRQDDRSEILTERQTDRR